MLSIFGGLQNFFLGPTILVILGFGFIGCAVVALVLSPLFRYRASTEVTYGYTTLDDSYQYVEQLDPIGGRTIRAAGDSFLDGATKRARIECGFDLSAEGLAPAVSAERAVTAFPSRVKRTRLQWFFWGLGFIAAAAAVCLRLGLLKV
ncbi:hypothetical protein [Subtercola vilae]|uniref:Uncharacterized protein n=1 Tax=Subtercola vilae TaxID=2056433 RepID=A0A4T2BEH9_9MICO|nr:hypothetical protein [Subtercola vilae]TIH28612.1 hypothetical protein D4765_18340 [Subtercola vilae]